MRPDYCPMANEPCQRICDVPCSAHRLKPADDSDMAVYKAIAKNYTAPQAQQPRKAVKLSEDEIAKAWSAGEHNASAATKRRITGAIQDAFIAKNGIEQ